MRTVKRYLSFILAVIMVISTITPSLAKGDTGKTSDEAIEIPGKTMEIDGVRYKVFDLEKYNVDLSKFITGKPKQERKSNGFMPTGVGDKTNYKIKIVWDTYDLKPEEVPYFAITIFKVVVGSDGKKSAVDLATTMHDENHQPIKSTGSIDLENVPEYDFYETENWDASINYKDLKFGVVESANTDILLRINPAGAIGYGELSVEVTQRAMTLYSNVISSKSPSKIPPVRGVWYTCLSKPKRIAPMPTDGKKYYSIMEGLSNKIYYLNGQLQSIYEDENAIVEKVEFTGKDIWVVSKETAQNVKLLIVNPETKKEERAGKFRANDTDFHFYVTGNHRTPFESNIREDLKVTFNTADNGADQDAKVNNLVKEDSRKKEDSVVLHGLSIKGTKDLEQLKDAPLTVDGVKMPANPEPANPKHTFLGWSTKYMAEPVTSADQFLDADKFTKDTIVTDNITVYPVFSAKLEDKDRYLPEYNGLEVKAGEVIPSGDKKLSASLYVKELDGTKGDKVAEDQVSGKLDTDAPFKIKDSYDGKDNFATDPTIDDKGEISFTVKSREDADFKQRLASGDIEVSIPVLVKYKDGSTEEVMAKVTIKQEETDKYSSKLEGNKIVVWKGTSLDNINWRDGVVTPTDDATKEAFEKVTVTEGTDPARTTDTVGTVAGKVRVTWADGSDTLVDQNLVVTEEIIKDSNADAPKDAISVTFKKGDGVKTIDGETIDITWRIKPNHEIKVDEFPDVVVDEEKNYDNNNKKWVNKNDEENHQVTKENNEFTAVAVKLSDEEIIPYIPDDKNDPANPNDNNVPKTEDGKPEGKPIDKTQFFNIAVKVSPNESGTLTIIGMTGKVTGEVVSALVKKQVKNKEGELVPNTWERVISKVTKNPSANYAFWYWAKEPNGEITKNDVKIANFIKNGQKIEPTDPQIPDNWVKLTLKKGPGISNAEEDFGIFTFEKGTILTKDNFPELNVEEGCIDPAWYDENKEKVEPIGFKITKDTKLEARAFNKENITGIEFAEDPNKMSYIVGQKLNLAGMLIKLTDVNGTVALIDETELDKYGVTIEPAKGTVLTIEVHDGQKLTAKVQKPDEQTAKSKIALRVTKYDDVIIDPEIDLPDGYVEVTFDPTRDGVLTGLSDKKDFGEKRVYYVKDSLTWGEAVEKGMEVPKATHAYYDFIFDGWAPRLQDDRELVKAETYVAQYYDMSNYYHREEKVEKRYDLHREMHYVQGTGKGLFSPNKGMTRAEAATILANVLRNEGFIKTLRNLPYPDVNRNAWYYDSALIVTQANVFKGTDKGMFEGERLITRAEWIATLARFQRIRAIYGNNLGIKDGHWATNEVEAAFQQGWLALYRKGVDFDMAIPRQEAVYIANRAFGKVIDRDFVNKNLDKMISFPDVNKANEFFYDIIAASNTYFTSKDRGEWLNSLTRKGDFILKMGNYQITQTLYRR